MQLTMKLKIDASPEDLAVLRETGRQYMGSFNRVAAVGYDVGQRNGVELHKLTYRAEREATDLPSQLVISARMRATEAVGSALALRRKGQEVSCPHSERTTMRYDARSSTIKLEKSTASLVTVEGRKVVGLVVPPYLRDRISWKVCSADLCEARDGRLFLHVVVEAPPRTPVDSGHVVGVDLGVNRPVVTSDSRFLGERRWRNVEDRYFRLRRALQSKGTPSAKRHLARIARKLNRFRTDCDHVLARRVVDSVPAGSTIVLEDLTNIRKRVKARKGKQRRRLHSWSFARLRGFLEYKAELAGSRVATVDPRFSSQKCSGCGHTSRSNRKSQASFECKKCGLRLDADLNAARNHRQNHKASSGMSCDVGPTSTGLSLGSMTPGLETGARS